MKPSQPIGKLVTLNRPPNFPENLHEIMEEIVNEELQPYQKEILENLIAKNTELVIYGRLKT